MPPPPPKGGNLRPDFFIPIIAETNSSIIYLKVLLFSFTNKKRIMNYFSLKAPLGVGV